MVGRVKHRQRLHASLWDRFHGKVKPDPVSGCWLWTGVVKELGYGIIGLGRRGEGTEKTHRTAWRLYHGAIPDGLVVCHKCDNPTCVNPDHLFLGTLADNARDCVAKGRNFIPDNRGERARWAKLTEGAVRHIRSRQMTGVGYARLYGVSKSAIYQIWSGQNWASCP